MKRTLSHIAIDKTIFLIFNELGDLVQKHLTECSFAKCVDASGLLTRRLGNSGLRATGQYTPGCRRRALRADFAGRPLNRAARPGGCWTATACAGWTVGPPPAKRNGYTCEQPS